MQETSEETISHILKSKSLIEEVKQKLITISYDLTKHYEGKNNTTNTTKEPVNLLVDKNDSTAPIMEKTAKYETLTLANITGREGQEDDEVKEVEENYEGEEDNEGEEEVNTVKPNENEDEVMSYRIMIT